MGKRTNQKKKKQREKSRSKEKTREEEKRKKTEVEIGFEKHAPQKVEKAKKRMKEADIIIPEMPPETLEKVKKTETEKELKELAEKTNFPEYSEKLFKTLKEMQKKGKDKEIKGAGVSKSELTLEKSTANIYRNLGKTKEAAQVKAEANKERNKTRAKELKKIIKENPGKKIYIAAGAGHTPVYHKLKEEIEKENKNIKIKREHLEKKDLHEKAEQSEQVKETYNPMEQLTRHFEFNTKTAQRYKELKKAKEKRKNPEEHFDSKEEYKKAKQAEKKIRNLEKQDRKFRETWRGKKQKKQDHGMSKEKADYEALLETFKTLKKDEENLQTRKRKKKEDKGILEKLNPFK